MESANDGQAMSAAIILGDPNSVKYSGCLHPGPTCSVPSELMCCEFNESGSLIAVGTTDASVTVFQPSTGKVLYKLHSPQMDKLPITSAHFMRGNPDNVLMVAYSSGNVRHWHVSTGQCLSTISEKRQTLAAVFAPDSLSFATAGSDGKLHIYDQSNFKLALTLESSMSTSIMDGHMSRVFALAYHPSDSRLLLSAGWDDTIQFWDTRESHSIRKISGPHVCGDALDIDTRTLNIVSGSWRLHDALQIWDFDSGKLISTLQPEMPTKLYSVCWAADGCVIAGGSQNHQATLIDVNKDKILGEAKDLKHGVYDVDFSMKTGLLALAAGSTLHVVSTTPKSQVFLTQED